MAIDGSFNLHFELERFLSRCPRLASIPEFDYLLKKGDKVTEEEVVKAVGELFLHPNYTIPLVGCFRPIVHKVVKRAASLLRLVPNLGSNSDDLMVEFDEDKFLREDEDLDNTKLMHVVDVYARTGKGLNLHELACLAFCRALEMVPFLLRPVLDYFQFAPAPFERIRFMEYSCKELVVTGSRMLNVVRASYRFLLAEPGAFTTLWDWSCFLDFVQLLADFELHEDEKLKRNILDLRWCSKQILSMVLKINDSTSSNFGLGSGEAFLCLLRWKEFCQDISLEKAGWYLEIPAARRLDARVGISNPDFKNFGNSSPVFSSEFHGISSPDGSISQLTGNRPNKVRTTGGVAGSVSCDPQQQTCYEGESLARLIELIRREIESARNLDRELPEKVWIKQQFSIGVNEVTRVLERMQPVSPVKCSSQERLTNGNHNNKMPSVQLQAILLAVDCNPRWLFKHLPSLAHSRGVPLLFVKDKKGGSLRLGELVKLKTAIAIGIKARGNVINQLVLKVLGNEIQHQHMS